MENTGIEKTLNLISVEREKDSRELKVLKETQEKQQQGLEESQGQIKGLQMSMGKLKSTQQEFIERSAAPLNQMEALCSQLAAHGELLKKPLIQKTVNVHHVPKLLYATVALFCICLSLSIGWYQSWQKASLYRNNDTKWRKLLLEARPVLSKIMQEVSASIEQDPDNIRDAVKTQEDHNQQVWELQRKMQADSAAMRALKNGRKAGDNNNNMHKK